MHVPDLSVAFSLGLLLTVLRRPLSNLEARGVIWRLNLFRVGDYVELEDCAGYVSHIGVLRTSVVFVEEGVLCTRMFQNGEIWHGCIVTIPPPEQPRACVLYRRS